MHLFSLGLLFRFSLQKGFFGGFVYFFGQISLFINERLRVDRLFGVRFENQVFNQILGSTHHNLFDLSNLNFWKRRWRFLILDSFIARKSRISMFPRGCFLFRRFWSLARAWCTWVLVLITHILGTIRNLWPIKIIHQIVWIFLWLLSCVWNFKVVNLLPECILSIWFIRSTYSVSLGLFFGIFYLCLLLEVLYQRTHRLLDNFWGSVWHNLNWIWLLLNHLFAINYAELLSEKLVSRWHIPQGGRRILRLYWWP